MDYRQQMLEVQVEKLLKLAERSEGRGHHGQAETYRRYAEAVRLRCETLFSPVDERSTSQTSDEIEKVLELA